MQGKLSADFSEFSAATDKAVSQLAAMESSGNKAAVAVGRVTEAGAKWGSSSVPDVTSSAWKAFENLGEAVDKAAPGLHRVADEAKGVGEQTRFSVKEFADGIPLIGQFIAALSAERLFEFAKGAVEGAGRLEDLHLATGISVKGLQEFQSVGLEFGVTMEQLARGVEEVSTKLANGDKNATSAVQMLGLTVKDLLAAGPQEAFFQIAEAAGRIEDPMLKGGIAAELFGGKLAKQLIPMLSDLREKMKEAGNSSAIMSDATVKAAHDFEVGLGHAGLVAKAWVAEIIGGWATLIRASADAFAHPIVDAETFATKYGISMANAGKSAAEMNRALIDQATAGHQAADGHSAVVTQADALHNRLIALRTGAMEPLSRSQMAEIDELERYSVSYQEIAKLVGASEEAIKQYTDSVAKSIAGISAVIRESEAAEREWAGVDKLFHEQSLKAWKDREAQAAKSSKIVNDAVLREFDAQTQLNKAMGLDASGAIAVQATAYSTLQKALEALHLTEKDGISIKAQEQVLMNAYTKELRDNALAQDGFALKQLGANKAIADEQKNLDALLVAGLNTFAVIGKSASDAAADIDKVATALKAAQQYQLYGGTPGPPATVGEQVGSNIAARLGPTSQLPIYGGDIPTVPHRAGGGPVSSGMPYWVGERGPELYVPSAAGSILPNGGGGITVNVVNHITQPLGTPQEIARVVGDAVNQTLRSQGVRLPRA